MTNQTLCNVLDRMDINDGISIKKVGNIEALLFNHYCVTFRQTNWFDKKKYKYIDYYNFVLILFKGRKAGIILQCDSSDIHAYTLRKYRNMGIISTVMRDKFLRKLWPDVNSVTCQNPPKYQSIKHLADLCDYPIRNEEETLYKLHRYAKYMKQRRNDSKK